MTVTMMQEWIKQRIEMMLLKFPNEQRLAIDSPIELSKYELSHPVGSIVIIWENDEITPNQYAGLIRQERRRNFGIYFNLRNLAGFPYPDEYLDELIQTFANNPRIISGNNDDFVSVKSAQFIGEESGIWTSKLSISLPDIITSEFHE